ncbi:iron-siderophore ABC transporter substrate-binding protein [Pandoraea terrigena]|uniref:Iron(3+)-hydroxamate-binding protein FhuD n=1 Tax=Pandoraea terrigena TaxID=2508292 RepID=A0A5E4UU55_9BURK|nr:iron-siderophore ABC transporter substrate-binding protein [Pandoraea terrigena]VVE03083.1 Iron(3+)-hydroxamate-binding protein FhuD [Pandoraea terrigena]
MPADPLAAVRVARACTLISSGRRLSLKALAAATALATGTVSLGAHAQGYRGLVNRASPGLPTNARRVVSLEFLFTESLLALDVTPLGVADPRAYAQWVKYRAERLRADSSVGTREQPNLEAIAALQPDLIVAYAYRHARLFDALARIAPTVVFNVQPMAGEGDALDRMLAIFRAIGDMTGRSAAAAQIARQSEARIAVARAQALRDGFRDAPVALLNANAGGGNFWAYDNKDMIGALVGHLGARNALGWLDSRQSMVNLSLGDLARHRAWSLIVVDDAAAPAYQLPVWQALPAVRDGRVAFLPPSWGFGGPVSLDRMTGRMEAAFASMARAMRAAAEAGI